MDHVSHDPVAAQIGTQLMAIAAAGLAAGTASIGAVTSLAPAGLDEVSAQAVMAFAAEGMASLATQTAALEELARAGAAIIEIAGRYANLDDAAANTLTSAGQQIISAGQLSEALPLAGAAAVRRLAETVTEAADAVTPLAQQGMQISQTVQGAVSGMSGTPMNSPTTTPPVGTQTAASVRQDQARDDDERDATADESPAVPMSDGARAGAGAAAAAAPIVTPARFGTSEAVPQPNSRTT